MLEAKKKALELLSKREHTRQEIREKLGKRKYEDSVIDTVLEFLVSKNYQCDRRFANAFAERRARQGHGEHSIKASLSQRGVSSDDSRDALDDLALDWNELAISVLRKKVPIGKTLSEALSENRTTAYKEKAKYARFLQSRGFSSSQITAALATLARSDSADSDLE